MTNIDAERCPAPPGGPDPRLPRTPLVGTDYHRDPYPLFAELTSAGQVHPVQFPAVHAWLVTGADAARTALTDPRLGKDHRRANPYFVAHASIMPEPQHSQLQVHLLHVDGDRHARMRAIVAGPLSARRTEALRADIRADIEALIDELPDPDGNPVSVDLVPTFAARLPLIALARAIGLPDHLRDRFDRSWATVVAPVGPDHPDRPHYERRLRELQAYIADIVADGGTGMIASIITAADASTITAAERDSMIFQLLVAGQDPVAAQLQLALLDLADCPDVAQRLRADPSSVPRAVEELLRHDSAFNLTTWRFLDHDDTLFGIDIPAGDSVIVALGAANRDPAAFDNPHHLDIDRPVISHLAFGHGAHTCPGAALARIELQEALRALLTRLPDLTVDASRDELSWSPAPLTRAVASLPVTYSRKEPRS